MIVYKKKVVVKFCFKKKVTWVNDKFGTVRNPTWKSTQLSYRISQAVLKGMNGCPPQVGGMKDCACVGGGGRGGGGLWLLVCGNLMKSDFDLLKLF